MVELTGLWLPILLSAVFVFVASAIIHMALGYHWGDWNKMPGEDKAGGPRRLATRPARSDWIIRALMETWR